MQSIPFPPLADGPPAAGETLKALRLERKLSLDEELSWRAGVSKSMLSHVERNVANPTVATLWRLAGGLGLEITDLLSNAQDKIRRPDTILMSAHETPLIHSRDGMCKRRILSPLAMAGQVEWYKFTIEPDGVLASDPHDNECREHPSVFDGDLTAFTEDEIRKCIPLKLQDTPQTSNTRFAIGLQRLREACLLFNICDKRPPLPVTTERAFAAYASGFLVQVRRKSKVELAWHSALFVSGPCHLNSSIRRRSCPP